MVVTMVTMMLLLMMMKALMMMRMRITEHLAGHNVDDEYYGFAMVMRTTTTKNYHEVNADEGEDEHDSNIAGMGKSTTCGMLAVGVQ